MEYKSCPFEVKVDGEKFEFEGYASVFQNRDSVSDAMQPGAFANTLRQDAQRVKVLWQHMIDVPIGKPLRMEEDSKGLYVHAKISKTEEGKRTMILLDDGVIDELSIGFTTIRDEWDKVNSLRKLHEVKLWEFSPVTFAANELAKVTGVKQFGEGAIPSLLYQLNTQLKAGRVLSDANKLLVRNAIDALQKLLGAAEPEPSDEAAKGIRSLMQEMKKTMLKG